LDRTRVNEHLISPSCFGAYDRMTRIVTNSPQDSLQERRLRSDVHPLLLSHVRAGGNVETRVIDRKLYVSGVTFCCANINS